MGLVLLERKGWRFEAFFEKNILSENKHTDDPQTLRIGKIEPPLRYYEDPRIYMFSSNGFSQIPKTLTGISSSECAFKTLKVSTFPLLPLGE